LNARQIVSKASKGKNNITRQIVSKASKGKNNITRAKKSKLTPMSSVCYTKTRWVSDEVHSLWLGMEEHGCNWCKIREKFLPKRTYYQVKDKGRRLLASEGWDSRSFQNNSVSASLAAKEVSGKVNQRMQGKIIRLGHKSDLE